MAAAPARNAPAAWQSSLSANSRPRHPPTLTMVIEAMKVLNERKGVSAVAIKHYILNRYPEVDPIRLKYYLRVAFAKGMEKGYLVRPLNSSARGVTGRFKLGAQKPKSRKGEKKEAAAAAAAEELPPLDGKTASKPTKAARKPKAKAAAEKLGRRGKKEGPASARAEGEEKKSASKQSKANAGEGPGKAPRKERKGKASEGKEALKKPSAPKAPQENPPSAPKKAAPKEGKMGARAKAPTKAEASDRTKLPPPLPAEKDKAAKETKTGEGVGKAKAGGQVPKPSKAKGKKGAAGGPKQLPEDA
ncbi:protein B4-like [Rhineura floridana]|uniref:protein B4-like n=1 Tax=Rhineura floridana TaxID=261503 RepID=UPI002AC80476|nr:protein B4-like [Rhineura floridana]